MNGRIVVMLLLCLPARVADACSPLILPPETMYRDSVAVVFAVPVARSLKPREAASDSYIGNVRETILWRTLISWKGSFMPGDQFTTRRRFKIEKSFSCGHYLPQWRAREPKILFLEGSEPFGMFLAYESWDSSMFEFLEGIRSR